VIDTAQLLGVKFGSLSHEAVGFTGRNVINQAQTVENYTSNEPIQVSQPSQRSTKEQLQTFGQNNVKNNHHGVGQTPQNELNNSDLVNDRFITFNENVQLPGVTPLKNDIVLNTNVTNDKIVDNLEIHQEKEEKFKRESFSNTTFLLCKFCENPFVSNKELQIHLKSHQPSNNILSSQNGASVENNSGPMISSQIDTAEIPNYTCDNCGKTLKTKKLLNRHELLHQECNICDYCNKRFSREKNLKKHLLHAHDKYENRDKIKLAKFESCNEGEKIQNKLEKSTKFSCQECGKMLSSKFRLNLHMKLHLKSKTLDNTVKNKLFPCKDCGKSISSKANLKRHMISCHINQKVDSLPTNVDLSIYVKDSCDKEQSKNSGNKNDETNNNSIENHIETNNETISPNKTIKKETTKIKKETSTRKRSVSSVDFPYSEATKRKPMNESTMEKPASPLQGSVASADSATESAETSFEIMNNDQFRGKFIDMLLASKID